MNVLSFFAHPDDETMMCGGTLALLAQTGASVHYLCATRGEGGEAGDPPVCSIEELGQVREKELACAVQALGGSSLTLLDYIDPRVGPEDALFSFAGPDELPALAQQLADVIEQRQIEAVLTHGVNGEYGHPAHIYTHQAARLAVEALGERAPLLYTVLAAFPDHPWERLANVDSPAHLVLDITPVIERKVEAALCHHSQHALFVRRRSEDLGRPLTVPEVILGVESLHRVLPPVTGVAADALVDLLQPYAELRQP
jgi:N-acetylglucosamine malate deacetylase 2